MFINVSVHNYNGVNHSAYTLYYSRIIIEIFDEEIIWQKCRRTRYQSFSLALSTILSFIFEIAMPFDIPYNFRQSLPRCDTITSPMIYDQSLLRERGKETIYEQWLWRGGHKTTGTARWKPLDGNYGGRSPDHLEGVKAQMKSADSPGKSAPGKGELCTSPRRATKDDGSVHAGVTAGVPNSHFVITPAAIRSPSRLIYRNPSIISPFRPSHLVLSVFSFCRHVSAFFPICNRYEAQCSFRGSRQKRIPLRYARIGEEAGF